MWARAPTHLQHSCRRWLLAPTKHSIEDPATRVLDMQIGACIHLTGATRRLLDGRFPLADVVPGRHDLGVEILVGSFARSEGREPTLRDGHGLEHTGLGGSGRGDIDLGDVLTHARHGIDMRSTINAKAATPGSNCHRRVPHRPRPDLQPAREPANER